MKQTMWQYAIVERNWNQPMNEGDLNHFGTARWELFQIRETGERSEGLEYIFKRNVDYEGQQD